MQASFVASCLHTIGAQWKIETLNFLVHVEHGLLRALNLIGMRGDTFISLSFLNQILSADFFLKLSKLFGGEN